MVRVAASPPGDQRVAGDGPRRCLGRTGPPRVGWLGCLDVRSVRTALSREGGAVTDDAALPGLQSSPEIDTTVSHSARIWDYWLGGRENYPVDREVGDRIEQMLPDIVAQA